MRLARDLDGNRQITEEEILQGLDQLRDLDKDGDKSLKGEELNDVFFEYGEDKWLSGNQRHHLEVDQWRQIVELRELSLDPPKINVRIDMRPRHT